MTCKLDDCKTCRKSKTCDIFEEVKNARTVAGIELEQKDELRIFCIFWHRKTGKYRLVQSDSVFSADKLNDVTYDDILKCLKEKGKKIGL